MFDPENADDTNEDIVYKIGANWDDIFAGNFVAARDGTADGFDKIAAYGRVNGTYRFLIDTDNDGVVNLTVPGPNINGLPVAGNFDGNAANGDEVGVFTGSAWWLDTNHDFIVDRRINSDFTGYPIVGDFDGDTVDDLATWTDDQFHFDLNRDGKARRNNQLRLSHDPRTTGRGRYEPGRNRRHRPLGA